MSTDTVPRSLTANSLKALASDRSATGGGPDLNGRTKRGATPVECTVAPYRSADWALREASAELGESGTAPLGAPAEEPPPEHPEISAAADAPRATIDKRDRTRIKFSVVVKKSEEQRVEVQPRYCYQDDAFFVDVEAGSGNSEKAGNCIADSTSLLVSRGEPDLDDAAATPFLL
jgi:hypothetical protein